MRPKAQSVVGGGVPQVAQLLRSSSTHEKAHYLSCGPADLLLGPNHGVPQPLQYTYGRFVLRSRQTMRDHALYVGQERFPLGDLGGRVLSFAQEQPGQVSISDAQAYEIGMRLRGDKANRAEAASSHGVKGLACAGNIAFCA